MRSQDVEDIYQEIRCREALDHVEKYNVNAISDYEIDSNVDSDNDEENSDQSDDKSDEESVC